MFERSGSAARLSVARYRLLAVVALAVGLAGLGLPAAAAVFQLPGPVGWATWEAERAEQEGAWQVSEQGQKGERYVQPAAGQEEAALAFAFETQEPVTLEVRPVWWPTGEEKAARRFPYPLARKPGPDAVGRVGTEVFCTAPAAGRVVVVDGESEKVTAFLELGGYLSDLVADEEAGRVYVAEALGDRVVVIDAKTRDVVREIAVAGSPWSLALQEGRLYVACRDGRRVVALDVDSGEVIGETALDGSPIGLELAGAPPTALVVRFQEVAFDVLKLEELAPDEEQFPTTDVSGKPPAGCGGPTCQCKWVEVAGPQQLAVASSKGRELVDVSPVTGGRGAAAGGLPESPGPVGPTMVEVGKGPVTTLAFFACPNRGLLGVVNLDTKKLEEPVAVGGYPAGIALDGEAGKLYVADAAGDRVVVVDAATRKIERELTVPGQPWAIAFVGKVAWQREELVPATEVKRLFVACRESRDVAVVSLESGSVIGRLPLRAEPRSVKFVTMPNTAWWPVMADDRIPFSLTPRVAVELSPVALDLATLEPVAAPAELAGRRQECRVACPEWPEDKVFSAFDSALVLGVNAGSKGERWVDLSAAADPQRAAPRALTEKDRAGTITVSLDGGPEFDWAQGIWVAPESKMLLVNDTEEYWQQNAPVFRLEPGRHELRVRAHSGYARLNALAVAQTLEPQIEVKVVAEPREVHGLVAAPTYHAVFYEQEPVRFTMEVRNRDNKPVWVQHGGAVRNYMGEVVEEFGTEDALRLEPGGTARIPLEFDLKETGRFTLHVGCTSWGSPGGSVVEEIHFLRLPKLEHPRLFWRADEEEAIRARIARYPNLFRRYGEWVERMAPREGRFPERFLPPGLTADDCVSVAPEDIRDPGEARDRCGWRNYEVGWRILATQFTERFLRPGSAPLAAKLEALRAGEKSDAYVMYHHHGPFFPGAAESVVDLAPGGMSGAAKLRELFAKSSGDMNVMPWTLVTLEEPLTPEKRALIHELMTWENNAERYFETHRGRRGGTWWQDPYSWCHCPMHGYALSFLMLRNFFGEERLFEKPVFRGYLTFQRYADPIRDNRHVQPNLNDPGGEPWRWIFSALTRHPFEKSWYEWEDWVKEMEGPLAGDEAAAVDKLMALEGRFRTGPMTGHANHFVTGVSVPVALALGWYDPEAPEVRREEMPPTAVFDVEGWVAMRSGWDEEATEVSFVSGVRDHTARHKPNHFTILKGGEYLIGTPGLHTDDGNNVGAWGNTVVVGDDWIEQWRLNLQHPRDGEHLVIDRFSPGGFSYVDRDRRLVGYKPAEDGWGGGLDLHGHTETLFMNEGRLLAYQTWPEVDYAAGEASNAWPVDQVESAVRQIAFFKPDLVVVYDRVKLGPNGREARWIAATAPNLTIDGNSFRVASGSAELAGVVVLPRAVTLDSPKLPADSWLWKEQKALEVRPGDGREEVEFLVVMRVGKTGVALPGPEVAVLDGKVSVKVRLEDRTVGIAFDRDGSASGSASIEKAGKVSEYELHQEIVDSYAGWQGDPRYQRWVTEPRFGFVIPEGDRR